MTDDWMTDEHKAAALEGFRGNPVAQAYERATRGSTAVDTSGAEAMISDMTAWLRETIAETKRIAEAAGGKEWSIGCDCTAIDEECRNYPASCKKVEGDDITIYDEGGHTLDQARHIALHDPRDALAQCQAHAAVLDFCDSDRVVRLLALAYQHRPGFREEWRHG